MPDKNKADGKLATPNEDGALAQNQSSTAAIADDSASNAKSGAERNADNANAKQGETDLKSRAERAINDAAIDRSAEPGPQVDSRDRAPKSINNAASQLAGLATDGGQKIAATDGANIPLAPIADSGLSTDLRLTSTRMPIEFQSALTANAQNDAARQVVAAIKTVGTQSNIDVQLDPPELGRVRISFQVDRADVVTAVVSADRADTLDIMRRNAEELTRALARAGFTDVNLNFESGNRQDEQGFAEQAAGAQSEILQDGQTAAPVVYVNVRADKVLNRLV
ncbi:MAG: flagellar hook-length control protein FliK [Pseudomonadota bacterium]